MSNKFWKKKEDEAKQNFDLEKVVDESLEVPTVKVEVQTDPSKGTELTQKTDANEVFQDELELRWFKEDEVALLLKQKEHDTLVMAIDTFTSFKSSMLDDFKDYEAKKAAAWLKERLLKKGYDV